MGLIYDSDPENIIEEFKLMVEVGGKIGEFTRMSIGFSSNENW